MSTPGAADDKVILAARRVAVRCGRAWGMRPDELLGAAWEGARKNPERSHIAAYRGCIDYLIWQNRGWSPTRKNPNALRIQTCVFREPERGGTISADAAPEPPARPPDPLTRVLELWADTRHQRVHWTPRQRVVVYLYAVEEMTMREIAAAFGVTESAVSTCVKLVLRAMSVDPRVIEDTSHARGISRRKHSTEEGDR